MHLLQELSHLHINRKEMLVRYPNHRNIKVYRQIIEQTLYTDMFYQHKHSVAQESARVGQKKMKIEYIFHFISGSFRSLVFLWWKTSIDMIFHRVYWNWNTRFALLPINIEHAVQRVASGVGWGSVDIYYQTGTIDDSFQSLIEISVGVKFILMLFKVLGEFFGKDFSKCEIYMYSYIL